MVDNSSENYEHFSPYVYVGDNPIIRTDPDGNDCRDAVKGALVAIADNVTGGAVNLRAKVSYNDAKDFNRGRDVGDIANMAIGRIEAAA